MVLNTRKKLLCVLLVSVVLFAAAPFVVEAVKIPERDTYVLVLSATSASVPIKNSVIRESNLLQCLTDFNGDGKIDVIDLILEVGIMHSGNAPLKIVLKCSLTRIVETLMHTESSLVSKAQIYFYSCDSNGQFPQFLGKSKTDSKGVATFSLVLPFANDYWFVAQYTDNGNSFDGHS